MIEQEGFGIEDAPEHVLKGVPPGSYTVEAVHEKYGRKEGGVTVGPNGRVTIDFAYDR